jgi:hypoxanthine phosphoribosyltransferase
MKTIKLADKQFELYLPEEEIITAVKTIAERINADYKSKNPVFVCVLNGAFMFCSDLMKQIDIPCEITFVKLASYQGSHSSGTVKTLIGLDENLKGRNVVVLEDIVDTGLTIETLIKQLGAFEPAEVKIATLLYKPDAYKKDIAIDYVAITIPNKFIVGYGLDYNGYGRNLKDIYRVTNIN